MTPPPTDLPAVWLAIVMALAACGLLARDCATTAHAQDRPMSATDREDTARCLVAEAPPGPDYLAILSVLSQRGSTLGSAARRYCALFVAAHPSARQRAIRLMPGGPSARIYARHWRAAQAAIDAWERGERPACAPDHFGDRLHDAQRARRAGWVVVDCGRTASIFWHGGGRRMRAVRADLARGARR